MPLLRPNRWISLCGVGVTSVWAVVVWSRWGTVAHRVYSSTSSQALETYCWSVSCRFSMDGPNVNRAFHKQLQSKIKLDFDCQMLDIGSCELHVGAQAWQWCLQVGCTEIRSFVIQWNPCTSWGLHSCHWQSSVRIEVLRYKMVRKHAERVLQMWPNLKTYVNDAGKEEIPKPSTRAFDEILEATRDPLTEVKLNAFHDTLLDVVPNRSPDGSVPR